MTAPGNFGRINSHRNRWILSVLVLILPAAWWLIFRPASDAETRVVSPARDSSMAGMISGSAGEITVSSDQRLRYGITLGVVALRPLVFETRTAGVVGIDETRVAQFAPKVSGVVERLFVNFTGQPVRRGQPLLQIYSPDLFAAQQEMLLAASLQRELGRTQIPGVPSGTTNLVEAARQRLRLADISEGEIAAIQRSGRVRRALTLYSPASGVVITKNVVNGQPVSAGEVLYGIADLSQVWIDVQVREAEAAAVRSGSVAYLSFAAIPGPELPGRVTYVYPTIDSVARSVRARIVLANPAGALKPGMYATVRILTPTRSALAVPAAAVLRTGEREIVFIELPSGNLAPREVRTGMTAGGYTEIISGIRSGQRIVTSAQFLLDSESNLGEIMKGMIGQGTSGKSAGMEGMDMQDKGARVAPGRK